ncbi:hypothetical protein D3C80_1718610 [compost metagenome]
MNHFTRGNGYAFGDFVQLVAIALVENFAVRRYQGCYAAWVEQVDGDNDSALVPLLQPVGVAVDQLRGLPPLLKLHMILVVVRFFQDRTERRTSRLFPNTVRV